METNDHRERRVRFLRPLSMTCKAMRSRLLPWIWEHVEPSWGNYVGNLNIIANASNADISLASSVKYFCTLLRSSGSGLICSLCRFMTLHSLWNVANLPLFVRCLESLPNLHMLEIGWSDNYITTPLENALQGSKLSQIRVLILPPSAHPLLKRCCNVEDVDCVVNDKPIPSDKFHDFLASIRGSKVKRLAIPLVLYCNTSSKWSGTPWYRMVRMMTDRLQHQDMWLRVEGSPNSQSSTLTQVTPRSREWRFDLTRLKSRAPKP